MHGGYSEVHSNCVCMLSKTSTIEIQIVREEHNLPVVFDSFVSRKAKKALASNMRSCFGDMFSHSMAETQQKDNSLVQHKITKLWWIIRSLWYRTDGPLVSVTDSVT